MRKVSSYKLIVIALGLMLVLGLMLAACGEEETETTAAPTETTAAPTETTAAPTETTAAPTETTAAGATGVVKVGMNAPLTGGAAAWGLPGMEGLTIVTNWYNEAGGVKIGDTTYTFEIVEYDNQAIPDEALLGARKLVLEDGCSLILDLGGATSASMAPFLTEQKIPSFTLIAQDLKADRPYLFAVTDNFPTYHALNVRYIKETYPDAKKMAILSQDDEIGIAAVAWSEAGAEVDGLEVVYDEPFSLDTTDFAQIVTKVLASEPDIINLGACYPEYQALICEQAYLQGWEGIITSACWDFGAILAKVPKEFMEGSVSNFPDFDDPKLEKAFLPPARPTRNSGMYGKRSTPTARTRRSPGNTPRRLTSGCGPRSRRAASTGKRSARRCGPERMFRGRSGPGTGQAWRTSASTNSSPPRCP